VVRPWIRYFLNIDCRICLALSLLDTIMYSLSLAKLYAGKRAINHQPHPTLKVFLSLQFNSKTFPFNLFLTIKM